MGSPKGAYLVGGRMQTTLYGVRQLPIADFQLPIADDRQRATTPSKRYWAYESANDFRFLISDFRSQISNLRSQIGKYLKYLKSQI